MGDYVLSCCSTADLSQEWFDRRVSYTSSCATASIVGYILGIGDRHTRNILIDTHTQQK